MSLCTVGGRPATRSRAIVVSVNSAVNPGSSSRGVVDKNSMPSPVEAGVTPSPGAKRETQADAEAKADGAADIKSGARGGENYYRVISGHDHEGGVDWLDLDIWAAADDDAVVAPQITIIPGFLAH